MHRYSLARYLGIHDYIFCPFYQGENFDLNLIFAFIGINKVLLFPATLFQQLYALSFLAVVATYQKSAGIQPR